MEVKKLIAFRKEAEKAVAEMPDGDLKLKGTSNNRFLISIGSLSMN